MKLRIALLFCAAAMYLSTIDEAFDGLVFISILCLGLIIALRLRPSLGSVVKMRRLPGGPEWVALSIGLGGGLVTVIAMALVFTALDSVLKRRFEPSDLINWSFAAVWALASVGPLWRKLRGLGGGEGSKDQGRLAAALFWGVPLGLGLLFTRLMVIDPLARHPSADVWLGVLAALPSCGLLMIAGVTGTFAAWRGDKDWGHEEQVFFSGVASVWALLGALMLLDLGGLAVFAAPRVAAVSVAAAVYTCAVAVAWVVTLWRLRTIEFRTTTTAVVAGFVLLCSGALSLIAPIAVAGSAEWQSLIALVLFPAVAVSVLVILLVVHPALNWLNGERLRSLRNPDPSAANLPTGRSPRSPTGLASGSRAESE